MSSRQSTNESGSNEPSHLRRIGILTLISSVVVTLLVVFVLGPHLPPGKGSAQSAGQVRDNTVLTAMLTPVICVVLAYFGYALVVFRRRGAGIEEGAAIRGDPRMQMIWIASTAVLVLFLAGYGTWALLGDGAGGGQGPSPIAVPAGSKLPVQIIAQQWQFTYRYPSYGGLESSELVLPANRLIELHVTSLDVIHSFWANALGVKADANPGSDNIVFLNTRGPLEFRIQCAELCGLWHGYMFDTGRVVTTSAFASWVARQRQVFAPVSRYMPAYATTYSPDPQRRG